jgi:hypothetical protein
VHVVLVLCKVDAEIEAIKDYGRNALMGASALGQKHLVHHHYHHHHHYQHHQHHHYHHHYHHHHYLAITQVRFLAEANAHLEICDDSGVHIVM